MFKVIVRRRGPTGPTIGPTLCHEFSVLMKAGAGAKTIASTIHPYPTQAEVIKKVVNLWRKAHFTQRTENILIKLFAWTRR